MGWDVRPFLAGAGIAGVALGFGAQALVKDAMTGMFILAENQIRRRGPDRGGRQAGDRRGADACAR